MAEAKAIQKHIRTSPRKVREVTDMIRGLSPLDALEMLPLIQKRAALPVYKTIKSAVANAQMKGLDAQNLFFKEIQVGEGKTLKRTQAVSRGMWHPIAKRMSHISITVAEKQAEEKKVEKTPKTKKESK